MRKRIITPFQPAATEPEWLNLDTLAEVEISSEQAAHPIESALLPDHGQTGWRAAVAGTQTIRLIFSAPLSLHRIRLDFEETRVERTQQYVLRWSADGGQSYQEIVRQQYNFSPGGATREREDLHVDLAAVTALELTIIPDIGAEAFASLAALRLA